MSCCWLSPGALLPAGFPGLARVPLIVVAASTAATAKPFSAAASARRISLWLRLVDLQCAAAKVGAIQCSHGFVRFAGVRHLNESEAAGASGFAVGNNAYTLHGAVSLK